MNVTFGLHAVCRKPVLCLSALVTLVTGVQAASVNLVQNGTFDQASPAKGVLGNREPGWTSSDQYTYLWDNSVSRWNASLPPSGTGVSPDLVPSPDGGNFIGSDGFGQTVGLSQTLTGLVIGQSYDVSFYEAGAQSSFGPGGGCCSGATTDQWRVGFGDQTQLSTLRSIPNLGFAPWMKETMTFTAASTSEVLSFFAIGTPLGEPPFALLDGVSVSAVTATPEPASWALMALSSVGLLGFARLRRKSVSSKS